MQKIILLDISVFTHRAINSWGGLVLKKQQHKINPNTFIAPVGYTFFNMIISTLKKIGVDDNTVIVACMDGRNSWRKDYYSPYKAQRLDAKKKQTHINWPKKYKEVNQVIDQLKEALDWKFLCIEKIEADDLIAVIAKENQDKEVIVVTIDGDLKQLCVYPNTKFYSLIVKHRGVNGSYVEVKNPNKILADKVKKGDVSDNIIVDKENDTEHDVELREFIMDLRNLPDFVVDAVKPEIQDLRPTKETDISLLPYQNSLAKKYVDIYNDDNVITYEDCLSYQEGKKKRKVAKKKKAKKSFK